MLACRLTCSTCCQLACAWQPARPGLASRRPSFCSCCVNTGSKPRGHETNSVKVVSLRGLTGLGRRGCGVLCACCCRCCLCCSCCCRRARRARAPVLPVTSGVWASLRRTAACLRGKRKVDREGLSLMGTRLREVKRV